MLITRTGRSQFLLALVAMVTLVVSCGPGVSTPESPTAKAAPPEAKAASTAQPAPTGQPATPATSPKPSGDQPKYGGVVVAVHTAEPNHFDPHLHGRTTGFSAPIWPAYSRLVRYTLGSTTEIEPDLAESWKWENPTILMLTLRKGVKFHDGTEFTSEDVTFSLDRIKTKSPNRDLLDAMQSIEAPDKYMVKIIMKRPTAAFLGSLADGWMNIVPKQATEKYGELKQNIVGTGPFKFKSYTRNIALDLIKNPDYFIKGRPYLDGLRRIIIPDQSTLFSAFVVGKVHLLPLPLRSQSEVEAVTKHRPDIEPLKLAMPYAPDLQINVRKPPTNDIRVRKAIDLGIDRRKMATQLMPFKEYRPRNWLSGSGWELSQDEIMKMPGFREPKDADIAEAKKLLAEAGYGPSKPLVIEVMYGQQRTHAESIGADDWSEAIGAQLKETLGFVEWKMNFAKYTEPFYTYALEGRYNALTLRASVGSDPDAIAIFILPEGGRNYAGINDAKLTEMFENQSQAMDPLERKKAVQDMVRYAGNLHAYTFVACGYQYGVMDPAVRNFKSPYLWVPTSYDYMGWRQEGTWLAK